MKHSDEANSAKPVSKGDAADSSSPGVGLRRAVAASYAAALRQESTAEKKEGRTPLLKKAPRLKLVTEPVNTKLFSAFEQV